MSGARGSKKSIWDTRFGKQKKALAFDECLKVAGWAIDDWVTVHPNGPDEVGRHVELDDQGRILHGMGKENEGKKMSEVGIKSAFPKDYHNEPNRPDDINHPGFKKRVWGYNAEIKENERKAAEAAKQAQEKHDTQEKKQWEKRQEKIARREQEIKESRDSRKGMIELRLEGKNEEAREETSRWLKENLELDYQNSQMKLERDCVANPPEKADPPMNKTEVVNNLAADDYKGFCVSYSLAYIANAYGGYNVTVGRDDTLKIIAGMSTGLVQDAGGVAICEQGFDGSSFRQIFGRGSGFKNETIYPQKLAQDALENANMQVGREYLFGANGGSNAGHSAIVRVTETPEGKRQYEYLELQDKAARGWQPITQSTWDVRFNLPRSTKGGSHVEIMDAEDVAKSQAFKDILPYVNKGK